MPGLAAGHAEMGKTLESTNLQFCQAQSTPSLMESAPATPDGKAQEDAKKKAERAEKRSDRKKNEEVRRASRAGMDALISDPSPSPSSTPLAAAPRPPPAAPDTDSIGFRLALEQERAKWKAEEQSEKDALQKQLEDMASEQAKLIAMLQQQQQQAPQLLPQQEDALAAAALLPPDTALLLAAGQEVFDLAGKNSDGTVSKREMQNAITGSEKLCALFGFKNGRLKHFSEWFHSVDTDHDGTLALPELGDWLLHHVSHESLAQWRDGSATGVMLRQQYRRGSSSNGRGSHDDLGVDAGHGAASGFRPREVREGGPDARSLQGVSPPHQSLTAPLSVSRVLSPSGSPSRTTLATGASPAASDLTVIDGFEPDGFAASEASGGSGGSGPAPRPSPLSEALSLYEVGQYTAAYSLLVDLAQPPAGDCEAQFHAGTICAQGKAAREVGMQPDFAEAVRWWEMAAAGGHVQATFTLALCYQSGRGGCRKDNARAWELVSRCCKDGLASAQFMMGSWLIYGDGPTPAAPGVPAQDIGAALQLLDAAADTGHAGEHFVPPGGEQREAHPEAAQWAGLVREASDIFSYFNSGEEAAAAAARGDDGGDNGDGGAAGPSSPGGCSSSSPVLRFTNVEEFFKQLCVQALPSSALPSSSCSPDGSPGSPSADVATEYVFSQWPQVQQWMVTKFTQYDDDTDGSLTLAQFVGFYIDWNRCPIHAALWVAIDAKQGGGPDCGADNTSPAAALSRTPPHRRNAAGGGQPEQRLSPRPTDPYGGAEIAGAPDIAGGIYWGPSMPLNQPLKRNPGSPAPAGAWSPAGLVQASAAMSASAAAAGLETSAISFGGSGAGGSTRAGGVPSYRTSARHTVGASDHRQSSLLEQRHQRQSANGQPQESGQWWTRLSRRAEPPLLYKAISPPREGGNRRGSLNPGGLSSTGGRKGAAVYRTMMEEGLRLLGKAAEKAQQQPELALVGSISGSNAGNAGGSALDKKAAKLIQAAAIDGNQAHAQFVLGTLYGTGRGLARNMHQATCWWGKATEKRHPEAAFSLAMCLHSGKGCRRDEEAALKTMAVSAEEGYLDAIHKMGLWTLLGTGTKRDAGVAAKWWQAAVAASGHVPSKCCLGLCYLQGTGVYQSDDIAGEFIDVWCQGPPPPPATAHHHGGQSSLPLQGNLVSLAALLPPGVSFSVDERFQRTFYDSAHAGSSFTVIPDALFLAMIVKASKLS